MNIVYSCKNGGSYTKAAILQEIQTRANHKGFLSTLSIKDAAATLNILYDILVTQLTWNAPARCWINGVRTI